ncbi:alpha/beta fold hydrolase [Ktedonobacter robiniae]|uniref:alpha/beta fold hydrolase n=1 Tax=Ktedonobacter robiniae TaxID=2778365 RepID=UPI001915BCB4|nr:alpha/beta fold hydrolase [Ktedonobacter robiniae]
MGTSLLPCSDQHVPLHSVGRRIWCRFAGTPENPPLLLLHGEWQSSAVFTPYFESLSRHYYVVAPDLLGHGFSSKSAEQSAYTISAWVEDLASLCDTTLHLDDIHVVAVGRFGLCLLDALQWHVVMAERLRGFALLPFPCAYPLSLLKHLASTDVDISYNAAQELTMVLSPLFPQDGVGVERAHGELLSQVRLVHPQANHVLCHLVEHMETEYTRWQTPLMILQTLKNLSCLVPQSDVSLVAETDSQEENQLTDTVPFSLPCVPDLSC